MGLHDVTLDITEFFGDEGTENEAADLRALLAVAQDERDIARRDLRRARAIGQTLYRYVVEANVPPSPSLRLKLECLPTWIKAVS